ncbi:MAG: hypothetical protein ACLTXT_01780 [Ruminococcus callidus]
MQHEKSCGAIVYRKSHGNTEILLIKHINSGHWSFQGTHGKRRNRDETAIREIREETRGGHDRPHIPGDGVLFPET